MFAKNESFNDNPRFVFNMKKKLSKFSYFTTLTARGPVTGLACYKHDKHGKIDSSKMGKLYKLECHNLTTSVTLFFSHKVGSI